MRDVSSMSAPWMPISPQRGLFESASQSTETVRVYSVSECRISFVLAKLPAGSLIARFTDRC